MGDQGDQGDKGDKPKIVRDEAYIRELMEFQKMCSEPPILKSFANAPRVTTEYVDEQLTELGKQYEDIMNKFQVRNCLENQGAGGSQISKKGINEGVLVPKTSNVEKGLVQSKSKNYQEDLIFPMDDLDLDADKKLTTDKTEKIGKENKPKK